jgi:hypothetical protein|nr:MAG TPA: hypothetical protein [Caudoviricetes sp.]
MTSNLKARLLPIKPHVLYKMDQLYLLTQATW